MLLVRETGARHLDAGSERDRSALWKASYDMDMRSWCGQLETSALYGEHLRTWTSRQDISMLLERDVGVLWKQLSTRARHLYASSEKNLDMLR